MTTATNHLAFGYNRGLPAGVTAAWGARLIVDQHGHTDLPSTRQGAFGDCDALIEWLNGGALRVARDHASGLLERRVMKTRERGEFVLHEDSLGKIVGNTNASAGYLYVAAWLKEEER